MNLFNLENTGAIEAINEVVGDFENSFPVLNKIYKTLDEETAEAFYDALVTQQVYFYDLGFKTAQLTYKDFYKQP